MEGEEIQRITKLVLEAERRCQEEQVRSLTGDREDALSGQGEDSKFIVALRTS